jgi:SAM-dependent methyltransferase
VEIDPVPEGLDGGHDPRRKRAPGHNLEISGQGPEGAAAKIAQEPKYWIELCVKTCSRAYALRESELFQGRTFLDAGCGSGMYCLGIAQKGALKVTGIDISPRMLDLARARLRLFRNVEFFEADLIDFHSVEPYDVSIVMGFFDYTKDPAKYIEKLIEITRERIILSFPRKNTLRAVMRKIRLGILGLDVYFYSRKDIEKIVFDKGLKIEDIAKMGQLYCLTITKNDTAAPGLEKLDGTRR